MFYLYSAAQVNLITKHPDQYHPDTLVQVLQMLRQDGNRSCKEIKIIEKALKKHLAVAKEKLLRTEMQILGHLDESVEV